MKKLFKSKTVLSAIIGIALCISLIAGATFAIFTSEASVSVSVSSATVKVTATVKDEQLYSYENIDINALTGEKVTRTMSDGFLAGGPQPIRAERLRLLIWFPATESRSKWR